MSSFALTIVSLPESVQHAVMEYLPARNLVSMSRTCRMMHIVAQDTARQVVFRLQRQVFTSSQCCRMDEWKSNPISILNEVTKDRILCVGGAFSETSLSELCPRTGVWVSSEELTVPRDNASVIVYGGCVYSVGGEGDQSLRSIDRFDLLQKKWIPCASMAHGVRQVSCVSHQGQLLVIGGEDAESGLATNTIMSIPFDAINRVDNSAWSAASDRMLLARKGHASVVFQGKLWVAGGTVRGSELTTSVETLDLDDLVIGTSHRAPASNTSNFVEAAPMTTPRRNFKLLVVRDQLYAVGGDNAGTIEVYDELSNSWMLETSFPTYRRHFSACVCNDRVCVFGGQDKRGKGLRSVDVYDVQSGTWSANCGLSPSQSSLVAASGATAGGRSSKANSKLALSIRKTDKFVEVASKCNYELSLPDYVSGFVCGETVSLSYSHLTW